MPILGNVHYMNFRIVLWAYGLDPADFNKIFELMAMQKYNFILD